VFGGDWQFGVVVHIPSAIPFVFVSVHAAPRDGRGCDAKSPTA
jgi:hypothetical protein